MERPASWLVPFLTGWSDGVGSHELQEGFFERRALQGVALHRDPFADQPLHDQGDFRQPRLSLGDRETERPLKRYSRPIITMFCRPLR